MADTNKFVSLSVLTNSDGTECLYALDNQNVAWEGNYRSVRTELVLHLDNKEKVQGWRYETFIDWKVIKHPLSGSVNGIPILSVLHLTVSLKAGDRYGANKVVKVEDKQ